MPSPRPCNRLARCLIVLAACLLAAPVLAQGGFNRDGGTFGDDGPAASDLLIDDLDDDGKMDAVVACPDGENDHMIYWSIDDATPPSPTVLADSRGHSLLVSETWCSYGACDVVVVDELGLRLYLNDGTGQYSFADEYVLTGNGAPVFAQAGHFAHQTNKGVVVGYDDCVVCFPEIYETFSETPYYVLEYANGVTSMHVMDIVQGGFLELLVLEGDTVHVYEVGTGAATLVDSFVFDGAYYIAPGNQAGTHLAVATADGLEIHEWMGVQEFVLVTSADWPVDRQVNQLVAHELTGDSDDDFVVRTPGFTYILERTATGFEMYEIIGYPDAGSDCDVVIADVDDDTHDDVVVGRCHAPHHVYYNRERIEVSISAAGTGEFEQVVDGQAYAEFTVTLDAAPISLVLVHVETDGEEEIEEPGGGGGDGIMDFPDITDFLNAQSAPLYHVPTAQIVLFAPGVTQQTFFVPLTQHFGGTSHQLHAHATQTHTTGAKVPPGTTAIAVINPGINPQSHWRLDGTVNAMVGSGQNTYIGGDFQGPTWDVNDGIADINADGTRRHLTESMNATGPVDIRCVEMDSRGNIYVGGDFVFSRYDPQLQTNVTIKNIARMGKGGQWDPEFHPNPDAPVNAIAVQETDVTGNGGIWPMWIYFGGEFTELEHPTNPPDNIPVAKIARMPVSGNPWSVPASEVHAIRVWSDWVFESDWLAYLDPNLTTPQSMEETDVSDSTNRDAVVHCLEFATDPSTGESSDELVIGGEKIFMARIRGNLASSTSGTDIGEPQRVANLVIVLTRSGIQHTRELDPIDQPPLVKESGNPWNSGAAVRSVSVASNFSFDDALASSSPQPAVAFGGDFEHIIYRPGSIFNVKMDPSKNLGLTNLRCAFPSTDPDDFPDLTGDTAGEGVYSVEFDQTQTGRIWVACDDTNPIWVYAIEQLNPSSKDLTVTRYSQFDFGPYGPVYELAFNPDRDEMVVAGNFSTRPVRSAVSQAPGWAEYDLPAHNITAYSTTTFPVGITEWQAGLQGAFGAHVPDFRASAPTANPSGYRNVHVAVDKRGFDHDHYVFVGTGMTEITAERSNLAAVGPFGQLLAWGPRTQEQVNALTVDTTTSPPTIYFAGEAGAIHGLPGIATIGAVPADEVSNLPVDWWTWVTGGSGAGPVVNALGISGSSLVIGGDFDALGGDSRSGVGAVALYDSGTVQGGQPALSWAPAIQGPSGTDPIVHTVDTDPSSGDILIGGDLEETGASPTLHGLVKVEPPGTGDTIDASFDVGLTSGDVVHDLEWNSSGDLYIVGDLTVGGVHTLMVLFDGSAITANVEGTTGTTAFAVIVNPLTDNVFIGGDFYFVVEAGSPVQRMGVAAFDSTLLLLSWQEDVLDFVAGGEEVRALSVGYGPVGPFVSGLGLWIGGIYTGGTSSPIDGGENLGFYALP